MVKFFFMFCLISNQLLFSRASIHGGVRSGASQVRLLAGLSRGHRPKHQQRLRHGCLQIRPHPHLRLHEVSKTTSSRAGRKKKWKKEKIIELEGHSHSMCIYVYKCIYVSVYMSDIY